MNQSAYSNVKNTCNNVILVIALASTVNVGGRDCSVLVKHSLQENKTKVIEKCFRKPS